MDLGSDQTSCHNPFNGGYYPVQLSFDEGNEVSFLNNVKCVKFSIELILDGK